MQSKLHIFATAFLVFSLSLFIFILGSPKDVLGVVQDSQCIANSCGTSEGTKQVPVYKEVCDKGCPTIHFEWQRTEYKSCPNGFFPGNGSNEDKCYRWTYSHGWEVQNRPTEIKEYSANVLYNKSHDPNKCHRPSDDTLRELYGMDKKARGDFKEENSQWKNFVYVNCRPELDGYETVACNDAPVILCEEECPTECGYEGGTVPDGQGGYKQCEPTAACEVPETHDLTLTSMCIDSEKEVRRWRVFHKDSSDMYFPIKLGYKIYPGDINELDVLLGFNNTFATRFTNPYYFETPYDGEGQTVILYWWNSQNEKWVKDDTKAANNDFCEIEYEKCSETVLTEGTWSEWIVDSTDSTKEIREKTNVYMDSEDSKILCQTEILKEPRDIKDEGDVLGESTEVKGTTTVLLAPTAAGDRSTIYLIQSLLMLVTGFSLIYVGKEYIYRY